MSYLPSTEVKERSLTEKQQAFLDNLITTGGNPKEAAELAGYSGNYHQVIKSLREEVIQLASDVLARSAPQAAFKLVEIMNSDAPIPQVGNKLQAAQTILDRVGVAKRDRLDVTHKAAGGIFILPEKQPIDVQAEEVDLINMLVELLVKIQKNGYILQLKICVILFVNGVILLNTMH